MIIEVYFPSDHRHLTSVTYGRVLGRKVYFVRCAECTLHEKFGSNEAAAHARSKELFFAVPRARFELATSGV